MTEFVALLAAVAKLLWPIVTFGIFFMFRKEIRGLFPRIRKGKLPGLEIELDKLEVTVTEAAAVSLPAPSSEGAELVPPARLI